MRPVRLLLLASLSITAVAVACTLNPQPLPPEDSSFAGGDNDASAKSDSGIFSPTTADASPGRTDEGGADSDASPTPNDAGDAGDAADADGG
jgi:hypothetical protein